MRLLALGGIATDLGRDGNHAGKTPRAGLNTAFQWTAYEIQPTGRSLANVIACA
jgi:hypothetical protein